MSKVLLICLFFTLMAAICHAGPAKAVREDIADAVEEHDKEEHPPQADGDHQGAPEEHHEAEGKHDYPPVDEGEHKEGEHKEGEGGEHKEPEFSDEDALLGEEDEEHEDYLKMDLDARMTKIKSIATKHDTNDDGKLSFEELEAWVLGSFTALTKKDALLWAKKADANNDTNISVEEHTKYINFNETTPIAKHLLALEQASFAAADLDNNKLLNQTEVLAFYDPYDYAYMHDSEVARKIGSLDTDMNGALSLAEFTAHRKKVNSTETDEAAIVEFKGLDKDSNGELSATEAKPWAIPHTTAMGAAIEAKHLIATADSNSDGVLSIDEITEHAEHFFENTVKPPPSHDEL